MKKKIGAVLTALTLFAGLGVATATSANAAILTGPYPSLAVCQQSVAAYERNGWVRVNPNGCYKINNKWMASFVPA